MLDYEKSDFFFIINLGGPNPVLRDGAINVDWL